MILWVETRLPEIAAVVVLLAVLIDRRLLLLLLLWGVVIIDVWIRVVAAVVVRVCSQQCITYQSTKAASDQLLVIKVVWFFGWGYFRDVFKYPSDPDSIVEQLLMLSKYTFTIIRLLVKLAILNMMMCVRFPAIIAVSTLIRTIEKFENEGGIITRDLK